MKNLSLNKLAIACTLALGLTACGGSSSDNSSSNSKPTPTPVPVPTNDLDNAKALINTAKTFITDSKAVSDAYENASDILNGTQGERFDTVLDIPKQLQKWMQENNQQSLTAQQVKQITAKPTNISLDNNNLYHALGDATLEPSNDFVAKLDNAGNLALSGTILVKQDDLDYYWDNQSNTLKTKVKSTNSFNTVYKNFSLKLASVNSSPKYLGTYGFDEIKVGTGADAFTVKAQANLNATFNKNTKVTKDFDFNNEQEQGLRIQEAVVTLSNVTLTTAKDTVAVKSLELKALDIENTFQGEKIAKTIPYSVKLTGKLTRNEPKTDLDLTLNLVAKDSAVKDALIVKVDDDNSDSKVEEKSGKYLPVTALLSIKGNVAKTNNANNLVTIPLNFQANLDRTSRTNINLKNLTATVNGQTLNVVGSSTLNNDYDTIKHTFTFSQQGGATLTIDVDENDKLVKTGNKIADIMVNGKDYGDLLDNNGKITAKFSDNTTIAL